jgi:hypothetical protein
MRNDRTQQLTPRPSTPVAMENVQPAQLVSWLNQQANSLQTIGYTDVVLSSSERGQNNPTLRDCSLYAAQPRNFRLVCGTMLTSQELDMGSNDREFWMYVKRLPGDNYFFCSHEDFDKRGVNFPVPFDPDWVMMALGMTPYDPNGTYTVTTNEREQAYLLQQQTTTRQGEPITKVTVFNVDYQQGRRPVVRGHIIYDANRQRICSAEIKAVRPPDPGQTTFLQVPRHVVLEWPQQEFRMELKLAGERINEDLSDRAVALFNRPQIRGTNPIDLARYQFVQPSSYRGQIPADTRSRPRRR